MAIQKKFYNPELEITEMYTEVWKKEVVTVKDIDDLVVTNHYWQDSKGELWVDFDNPMENVHGAFEVYRQRKGYMSPVEIKDLRHRLKLSVREFADALGIGSSSLTQIENNQRIQVKYQENLFEAANDYFYRNKSLPAKWLNQSRGAILDGTESSYTVGSHEDYRTNQTPQFNEDS